MSTPTLERLETITLLLYAICAVGALLTGISLGYGLLGAVLFSLSFVFAANLAWIKYRIYQRYRGRG